MIVDFQQRYGLRFSDALRGYSWNEMWALVTPILRDPYSHVVAAALGHVRPAYPVEESAVMLMDFYRVMNRGKNAPPVKPLPRPWHQPAQEQQTVRSVDQKQAGRKKLAALLGIE